MCPPVDHDSPATYSQRYRTDMSIRLNKNALLLTIATKNEPKWRIHYHQFNEVEGARIREYIQP